MGAGAFESQLSHWILNLDRLAWLMVGLRSFLVVCIFSDLLKSLAAQRSMRKRVETILPCIFSNTFKSLAAQRSARKNEKEINCLIEKVGETCIRVIQSHYESHETVEKVKKSIFFYSLYLYQLPSGFWTCY